MPLFARIRLFFHALIDPRTPRIVKILSAIAILYVLSPIDFVPDFIPVLGQADDIVVFIILIMQAYSRIPADEEAELIKRKPVIDV